MIELIVCSNDYIKKINKDFRGVDKETDVLSFPLKSENNLENIPLGSIVISADMVKKASKKFGHSQKDEFTLLFIHATLHLLGYDHEIDNGQMRKMEESIIEKFNLPNSLIVRSS